VGSLVLMSEETEDAVRIEPKRRTGGFTLIELLVVMAIIGIVVALIMTAAMDGVRRAEERATQALITKLDLGISDRIEALLSTRVDANQAHQYMAGVYNAAFTQPTASQQRAQVIAQFDMMKAELPDVFFVQIIPNTFAPGTNLYPLNFAAQPYPGTPVASSPLLNFVLPLGNSVFNNSPNSFGDAPLILPTNFNPAGTGIYGASYAAAAGVYKNLGYVATGYDQVDNDADGFVDEWDEGVNAGNFAQVTANLQRHMNNHATARSEMLFALLVEGQGPLGSVFNIDEFTDREVRDTDGDGLPEFVDSWGQPLQFYRWPIYYRSDLQRGINPQGYDGVDNNNNGQVDEEAEGYVYQGPFEPRQLDPLDPNQLLVAPAWWSNVSNNTFPSFGFAAPTLGPRSTLAVAFENYFHSLVEMEAANGSAPGFLWDRGVNFYGRRAYYSKFLIASSGPDRALGIAQLQHDYGTGATILQPQADTLVLIENAAASVTPIRDTTSPYLRPDTTSSSTAITYQLINSGLDDITNHNLQAPGGVAR
jgi:prepilin-type N-terminal cleavage/methylation domain-containing protein